MTSVFTSRHSFSYPRGDQGRGFLSGRVTSLSIHVRTHRVSARRERDYVGRGRGRSLCHVCRREKFASAARIRRPSCATVYLAAAGRNARRGKTRSKMSPRGARLLTFNLSFFFADSIRSCVCPPVCPLVNPSCSC